MSNIFNKDPNKSISESIDDFEKSIIDANRTHVLIMNRNTLIFFVIFVIVVTYISIPKTYFLAAQENAKTKVNPYRDPVIIINEENLEASNKNNQEKMIPIKNLRKTDTYYVIPIARYSISGRLFARNKLFVNYSEFDRIAQMDLGLVWGDIVDDKYFSKISSNNKELLDGSRILEVFFSKQYEKDYGHMTKYLNSHHSQTNVIPANKNIKKALSSLRTGQVVQLDGYLVDVYNAKRKKIGVTSIYLDDNEYAARGYKNNGTSSEIMYVMRVQIDNKVYK